MTPATGSSWRYLLTIMISGCWLVLCLQRNHISCMCGKSQMISMQLPHGPLHMWWYCRSHVGVIFRKWWLILWCEHDEKMELTCQSESQGRFIVYFVVIFDIFKFSVSVCVCLILVLHDVYMDHRETWLFISLCVHDSGIIWGSGAAVAAVVH